MTDQSLYHAGELAVQRRAGVEAMAAKIARGVRPAVPEVAAAFLADQTWVILATTDAHGRPWASVARGPAGFVTTLAEADGTSRVYLATRPHPGDPLAENLGASPHAGLLAIDLATRRRMRVNGRLRVIPDGIVIEPEQVYSNCPKYIQRRTSPAAGKAQETDHPPARPAAVANALSPRQREWLRAADTFFVGSANPGEGVDASHRGGRPGFIQVEGNRIRWPDYPGNMMFNTLGNIEASGRVGLLVPDFTRGAGLLLTASARVEWTEGAGAERVVEAEVEQVVELERAFPALRLVDYSPHLPEE